MSQLEAGSPVLSRRQYEALLDAAETYREALVVRLCGDVGLRPAELAQLTVDDVEQVRIDPPRYLVRVPAIDDRDRRAAYLPTHVERELRRYARSNGLSTDDRIFSVTPRRLQMLVSEVADRASDTVDDPALKDVSSSDLRRYFARRALVDHDVNPRAVKAAGGWRSFEALEPYLAEPTEAELVDAFETVERPSGPRDGRTESGAGPVIGDDSVIRLLLAASDRYALVRLDEDGYVERWNRSAAAMFGYRAGEIVGTHVSTFYPDEAVEEGAPEQVLSAALEESGYEDDGWRVHKDGTRFRATEVISPLRDDRGRHRGFAVFLRDISAYQEELESIRSERDGLERRAAIARRHRELTRALLDATDHETVETTTCETLVDGPAYAFAWIDRPTVGDRPHARDRPREWRVSSGIDPGDVDRLHPEERRQRPATGEGTDADPSIEPPTLDANAPSDSASAEGADGEPARSAANDGAAAAVTVETDVEADVDGTSFDGAIARVPLAYGDTVYGTLAVATERPGAFDDSERAWLETIGRLVGYVITAVRRRNLLLSDRVVELEIACRDDRSFFVDASKQLGCRFELDSLVPVSESTHLYYLDLEGASPADVFELAEADPGITDWRLVETEADGGRLEFVVEGSAPTLTLTEYGVTVREAVVEDGTATITGECAADADLRTIMDGLRAAYPDSELIGKREAERTVQTARQFREGLEDRLTDRQEATLRAAYFGGYYDWPRESTAEEIADAMGVSSPTLHNHLRKAQHELLRTFFDDPSEGHRRTDDRASAEADAE
ncbi:bacterio-opsin activator domain-containing protein [Halopiger xanaduensis]|uniref:Putative PAS/PAC sensor protein n=1 Tax=Halopiger xanaduensis (strain DSM 18323 / JCM 14033 / SH-6) TaxID=797210 RepID=F8DC32_HALXS|nr:bacterio-opsin activator domain-containing protein [Halopiger xanaduensis]AEH37145.1 putative PAS/PAC sensor protein [Halopiger xanaduensis SH-6]